MDAAALEQDKLLVERAQRDPDAFGLLYEQHYDAIFNYILRRTGQMQVTEDIVSQTFLVALRNLGKYKWQGVPFSAWLYRIAINEMNAHFRRGGGTQTSLEVLQEGGFDPSSDDDVEREALEWQEVIDKNNEYQLLRQAINALPPQHQEVIALRFFAGKSLGDIAAVLGKPTGTVKSLLHRGLEKLKQTLNMNRNHATFAENPTYTARRRGSHEE